MHTKAQCSTLWPSHLVGSSLKCAVIACGSSLELVIWWNLRTKNKRKQKTCTHTQTHVHMCTIRTHIKAQMQPHTHINLQCQDDKLKSSWPCVHKISHRANRPALEQCTVKEKNSNWGSLFKLREEKKGWRLSFSLLFLLLFIWQAQ